MRKRSYRAKSDRPTGYIDILEDSHADDRQQHRAAFAVGYLDELRQDHEREPTDLTVLLLGLCILAIDGEILVPGGQGGQDNRERIPSWMIDALIKCVYDGLKHQPRKKSNQLKELHSRYEDLQRWGAVTILRQEKNLTPMEAYREAARMRAQITGVHVEWGAIRASCRAVEQNLQGRSKADSRYSMAQTLLKLAKPIVY